MTKNAKKTDARVEKEMNYNEIISSINDLEDTECSCQKCQEMCEHRPCWGTPDEIQNLIDLGYANKLMIDYWVGNFSDREYEDTYVVSPAIAGYEKGNAPFWRDGRCTFLTSRELCEIHKYKPSEGKKGNGCNTITLPFNIHERVAMSWDTPKGREVVSNFEKIINP